MRKNARTHNRAATDVPLVNSHVLITESEVEFAEFERQLTAEINPQGVLARMYAEDLVAACWEIRRYRLFKNSLINSQYRAALVNLYNQLTRPPSNACPVENDVEEVEDDGNEFNPSDRLINKLIDLGEVDFTEQWFTNSAVREQFRELLKRYRLDEGHIGAEAIRLLSGDLDDIERILASLEFRRDRILRNLKDMQTVASKERQTENDVLPLNGRRLNGPKAG